MKNYDCLNNFVIFKITDESQREFLELTTFHNRYNFKYNLNKYINTDNKSAKSHSPLLKFFRSSKKIEVVPFEELRNVEYYEAFNRIVELSKSLNINSSKCVL